VAALAYDAVKDVLASMTVDEALVAAAEGLAPTAVWKAIPARVAVLRSTPRVAMLLAEGAAPARGNGSPGGDAYRGGVRAPRGRDAAVRGLIVVVTFGEAGIWRLASVMAGALVLLGSPGTRDAARSPCGHRGGVSRCQGHVEAMQRVLCHRHQGW